LSKTFKIKRGDTLPQMRSTISTSEGVTDLTNVASVSLFFKRLSVVLERAGVVEAPATSGVISYTFVPGDWAEGEFATGRYRLEFELTYTGGSILTAPTSGFVTLVVESDLDDA